MVSITGTDTLKTRRTLTVGGKNYDYFSLKAAEAAGIGDVSRLPYSLKVVLENLLRRENGRTVTVADIKAVADWLKTRKSDHEIAYLPARVLMQDFTGVPAVCDLAAMRDAMVAMGGDADKINPLAQVDLVIDHSLTIDFAGTKDAFAKNVALEFERNKERYEFLKWGQSAFRNFRVVPPGTGICHQVNLEYLSQVVWTHEDGKQRLAFPDTLVGTDSHTTMVNGLAVLGWGVGGIEAEAVMLGQPISMLIPEVVGFKMTGALKEGMTATDLVLTVVQMLRKKGVVSKFVEFYGPGLANLSLADKATIANMAPEYGATCGFFPIDKSTIDYLTFTGRDAERIELVEAYAKAQGMWSDANTPDAVYTDTMELDLTSVEPSIAGPKRPQDRIALSDASKAFKDNFKAISGGRAEQTKRAVANNDFELEDGAVIISSITSCTNTSNPAVLIAAGLVAKKAHARDLKPKPWVKTSFAPGSQVVQDYMEAGGLMEHMDAIGFNLVGFGCATCIGNSGVVEENVQEAVEDGNLTVAAVLSGNRNFEGRVHPLTRANYLASPPLVVVYALAGNINVDVATEPLGHDPSGEPVFLKDIWPTNQEVHDYIRTVVTPKMYRSRYANVFQGDKNWRDVKTTTGQTFKWSPGSTYIQHPPFFVDSAAGEAKDIIGARALAILGASVTTDHISPAGNIKKESPAGEFLLEHQVRPGDFNSYGARRGNHEVMMRGTFANIRIKNEMAPGTEGGVTTHQPSGEVMSIYHAAMRYIADKVPLIVIGGSEYGTGSSRDWAAKGTRLLGASAVIVETFERIHRSNLVGMGVLPLQFQPGVTRQTLKLDGTETFDLSGLSGGIKPHMEVTLTIHRTDGSSEQTPLLCRIDTVDEVDYYLAGGILQYVLRNLQAA
ncbi:MAG: aconitate hydratase AcnA [Proteobacteria bacterium]|nr:aconitate hydratase AcnA [Pseudomonadota bacterium]